MDDHIMEGYIAYSCNSFKKERFQKVLQAVFYYNQDCEHKKKLILSGVPIREVPDYLPWIQISFGDLKASDYLEEIKVVVIDGDEKEDVFTYFSKGIICLAHESDKALIRLLTKENCGLYYSDVAELMAIFAFLFDKKNEEYIECMKRNARSFAEKNIAYNGCIQKIKSRKRNREESVKSFIKKQEDIALDAGEKLEMLTSAVKDSSDNLWIVCPDDMDMGCVKVEFLLIFQYIKLYINPNAIIFFSGSLNKADAVVKLLKEQIRELGVQNVVFGKPNVQEIKEGDSILLTFYDTDQILQYASDYKYLITMGIGITQKNIYRADLRDVEEVAEFIGMLLYGEGEPHHE